jgi:dynein heavy chain 1
MNIDLSGSADTEARFTALPGIVYWPPFSSVHCLEYKLQNVGTYVDKWLQFQSLWDLQSEQVYDVLGESVEMATAAARNVKLAQPLTLRRSADRSGISP